MEMNWAENIEYRMVGQQKLTRAHPLDLQQRIKTFMLVHVGG